MKESKSGRVGLIEAIQRPLGFFVLALLIVEAFLATVIVGGNLDWYLTRMSILLGVLMFVIVVGSVVFLMYARPHVMTEER